jgi:3-hydroxyacyl-CoA dehydrogenase/enoyl-CoA hydratase/3-hydroxybutyryl-CoA epimerase/enoyl-CoA isomerase
MIFDGKTIQVDIDKEKICHVIFDIKQGSANVIGNAMMEELPKALEAVKSSQASGVLYRSQKDHFIFGADITEFLTHFKNSKDDVQKWISKMNHVLNGFEDLEIPSVVAINGFALGGGFEVCLLADYRIASSSAKVGLPETKLGIMPGWGGSVRLPRLTGADHAIEWITSGRQYKASDALKIHAIDAVVEDDQLHEASLTLLRRAIQGELDWKTKKNNKKKPLLLNKTEAAMTFETSKGFVAGVAGPHLSCSG